MVNAGEYFLYMVMGVSCLIVSMMGYITGIALIYPIIIGMFGLICFWLPFIIFTIYEDV